MAGSRGGCGAIAQRGDPALITAVVPLLDDENARAGLTPRPQLSD